MTKIAVFRQPSLDLLPSNILIMTQELIANMLSVRREGVTEAAGNLQRAGLIAYSRGKIEVLNRFGIEERVCECYQVVKTEFDRLLPPLHDLQHLSKINQTPDKFVELRFRAENLKAFNQLMASNTVSLPDSIHEIRSAFHELDTYRIELELQNEELLTSQAQLQESHEDYINLYDFAPIPYVTLDNNNLIRHTNIAFASLFGVSKAQLVNQSFTDYIRDTDQDVFYQYRQSLLNNQNPKPCKLHLHYKNHEILWLKCEGFLKKDKSNLEINLMLSNIESTVET